ncbi:prolyl-tRNA synthetase associated domain-containing protein [Salmonella enterica subsp. enterica serovar Virchow]|nr:prolyl-tRNA synthetase associated domain-containing protein [Salmonella enterica subsp. enterica]EBV3599622.1 prolyl-tRNA synthetase associated domain-containing protein [Salmonella enterica subsp. enterica serovar Virchow]EFG9941270.1 prolyl-tRNA synthetase associated domain-containing protein [Escherichia coli]
MTSAPQFDRERLLVFLADHGIAERTVDHPPLATVADSQALRGQIEGGHTKNLFLKDKKGRHFLVSVEEDAVVDLKTIHQAIGGSGRVSFGNAEAMMAYLGVKPGAVTLFGAANDPEGQVTVVIDEALLAHETINAHPLVNTATTAVSRNDMLRFLELVGHKPLVLKVAG